MKSEWRVTSQYIGDTKEYAVYRLLDTQECDHSGNREYSPIGYVEDRAVAQIEADRLNALEEISFTPSVRMIRGYLLDVQNGISEERTVEDSLDSYYKMLNCSCIDITIRKLGYSGNRYFEFVVDDEGTFKSDPIISAVDNYGRGMFVGNLFITGIADEEGNLTSLTDKDIKYIERFLMYSGTKRHPEPYIMLDQVEYAR